MPYATVSVYSKDFVMVETPDSQKKETASLNTIFNNLEKDNWKLITSGGSNEGVFFVFHRS